MSELVDKIEWRGAGLKTPPRIVLRALEKALGTMPQVSRYTIVSVLALGLDTVVFLALTHSGAMTAALAGLFGYAIGLLLHFTLSSRFVFDRAKSSKSSARLFAEFAASGLVGLAITWAMLGLIVDAMGFMPVIGKAAAVVTSFFVVYLIRRSVVFTSRAAA